MKIGSIFSSFKYLNPQTEKKQDGGGNGSGGGYSDQQQDSERSPQKDEVILSAAAKEGVSSSVAAIQGMDETAADNSLETAVDAQQHDAKVHSNDISVDRIGTGPGLKIVLKDREGAILRQLSGEDFEKLRSDAKVETTARGRLLDQKA